MKKFDIFIALALALIIALLVFLAVDASRDFEEKLITEYNRCIAHSYPDSVCKAHIEQMKAEHNAKLQSRQ